MDRFDFRDYYGHYRKWHDLIRLHKRNRKMRIFSLLLMLLFFAGAFITGIIYLISKAISGISFNPQSNAWKSMLERLRRQVQNQVAGKLVPWDQEIMSLLSFNRSVVKKPGFFDSTAEGIYTTIFHEPVLAYATQQSGDNSVTVARTSDREFIFRKKAKETEIWINGQPFAVFTGDALIAAGRTNRVLAQLHRQDQDVLQLPVMIGDKEVASLSSPGRSTSPNPRALTLLRELNPEEENAVLALAVMRMTR